MWRYLRLLGCPTDLAEDVMQEAFLAGLARVQHARDQRRGDGTQAGHEYAEAAGRRRDRAGWGGIGLCVRHAANTKNSCIDRQVS